MISSVRIQLRILLSGIVWGAIALAFMLLGLSLVLEKLHFVEKVTELHMILTYEMIFPLVAVLIFSQLFADEIEEGIMMWILSLPVRGWLFLTGRWAIGVMLIIVIFIMSWLVIDVWVVSLAWGEFAVNVLPPVLWLGNLAMLAALAGRNYTVGLAAPLCYWIFEAFSKGAVTQNLYLFMNSSPDNDVFLWNRSLLILLAGMSLLISTFVFSRKNYFI